MENYKKSKQYFPIPISILKTRNLAQLSIKGWSKNIQTVSEIEGLKTFTSDTSFQGKSLEDVLHQNKG